MSSVPPPRPPYALGSIRGGSEIFGKVPVPEVYTQIKITSLHSYEVRHDFAGPNGEDSQEC